VVMSGLGGFFPCSPSQNRQCSPSHLKIPFSFSSFYLSCVPSVHSSSVFHLPVIFSTLSLVWAVLRLFICLKTSLTLSLGPGLFVFYNLLGFFWFGFRPNSPLPRRSQTYYVEIANFAMVWLYIVGYIY